MRNKLVTEPNKLLYGYLIRIPSISEINT